MLPRAALCFALGTALLAAAAGGVTGVEMPSGDDMKTNVYELPPPGPTDGPARQNCTSRG